MKKDESIQLVLFDLDGTALESVVGSVLSERLKNAITASPSSVKISITTGRSWDHFWPIISDITDRLEASIISGGSQIVDCKTQDILWQIDLSFQQIDALNRVAAKYSKPLSFNNGVQTVGQESEINKDAKPTIVYMLDIHPGEIDEVYTAVQKIPYLHAAITNAWGSTGDYVLHITHADANKGTATIELLRILGLGKEKVIAIGDGLNDIPMFKEVGNPLAVAGSIVDGHEAVCGTVGTLMEDGVAIYIESLCNKEGGL